MSDNPSSPPVSSSSPVLGPATVPASAKEIPKTLEEFIKEKAPDALKDMPGSKRAMLAKVTIERHELSMRGGPLPDPAELAAYNQIIPNGADRIMKMAEEQSSHRMRIETVVISSQQRQGFLGQLFGLIIGLAGLGMATYAAINGQPWFGATIGGATLVSLVSAFLYSRNAQKRESSQKREQMQEIERQMRGRPGKGRRR